MSSNRPMLARIRARMSDVNPEVTTKLVVIGGGYLQLPLILKAREMGIETHAFAWEEGAEVYSIPWTV